MPIPIIAQLSRQGSANFPIALGEDIKGAFVTVADVTARDAIPTNILRTGAICRIANTSTYYEWNGSAWISFTFGSGATVIDWKDSVRFATTTALAASTRVSNTRTANANGAFPTVDGVTAAVGNRFLDKDNATGADRGIWEITSLGSGGTPWVINRASDADTSGEVTSGMGCTVAEGTANGGKIFLLTTADPITLNTTSLTFAALSGGVTAGNGLTGTSTLSVLAENATIAVGAGGVKRAAITGDVTIADGSNTAAITADSIVNADINTAAALAWSKFATAIGNQGFTGLKSLSYNSEVNNTGATPTVNFTTGDLQKITASANCTPTFVAPAGIGWVQICFIQDSTPRTFTQPGSVLGSPPQPSTVSGSRTFYQYFYDGTNYLYSAADTSTFSLVDGTRAFTGGVTITQAALATGSPHAFKVTGGAHTTLTASTQAPDVDFALARTVQFATGALASQRAVRITAPTYAFVGASTLSDAATVAISGAPVAGTNATLTRSYALWVEGGLTRLDGDLTFGPDTAVAAATARVVNIKAPNATGSGATVGGDFNFTTGTGATEGAFNVYSGGGSILISMGRSATQHVVTVGAAASTTSILQFLDTSSGALAYVLQARTTAQATGRPLIICGQNAATTGGAVIIASGGVSASTLGTVTLKLGGYASGVASGTSAILFELKHLGGSQRLTALNCPGSGGAGLTTTEMPTNTGDLVTFIGDAATIPSANGVNGHIYYSDGAKPAWRFNGTNLRINGTHATASAGGGAAAPATVEGYLDVQINGAQRKMPYYAA